VNIEIRASRPEDAEFVVPYIYSSGPYSFDYVFAGPNRTATEFLLEAFSTPGGELGYRDHVSVCRDEQIVGCGTIMSPKDSIRYMWNGARQIVRHYGLVTGSRVMRRALAVERVIKPAAGDLWIIAHLGVAAELQQLGIGARLIEHLIDSIRKQGGRRVGLDVALINPRAEALYKRMGFEVTAYCESKLSNQFGAVPNFHRMEMAI
jgi:ribosomal protein S18 acetylase RimI-like enzyme